MGKSTTKWPCSIAMFKYQRVNPIQSHWTSIFLWSSYTCSYILSRVSYWFHSQLPDVASNSPALQVAEERVPVLHMAVAVAVDVRLAVDAPPPGTRCQKGWKIKRAGRWGQKTVKNSMFWGMFQCSSHIRWLVPGLVARFASWGLSWFFRKASPSPLQLKVAQGCSRLFNCSWTILSFISRSHFFAKENPCHWSFWTGTSSAGGVTNDTLW